MDCSLLSSSVHGIPQARMLEWIAISFSKGPSWPWDQTWVSCIAGRFFTIWAIRKFLKLNIRSYIISRDFLTLFNKKCSENKFQLYHFKTLKHYIDRGIQAKWLFILHLLSRNYGKSLMYLAYWIPSAFMWNSLQNVKNQVVNSIGYFIEKNDIVILVYFVTYINVYFIDHTMTQSIQC